MDEGIAARIKSAFPEAFWADQSTGKGNRTKLGDYSHAEIERQGDLPSLVVVNAYTQYDYKGKTRLVDYEALRSCFRRIKQDFSGKSLGYSRIGAGMAKGDWGVIASIINEELQGENHTCVVLVPVAAQAAGGASRRKRR
eukprot:Sro133_g063040.2  (140) ;mRNA; f:59398-59817